MNPSQLADQVERIILSQTDKYAAQAESLQGTLYNYLVRILKNLQIDSEGYIMQSAANRSFLLEAENLLQEMLPNESFISAVNRTLESIPTINAANVSYFSSISDSFKENRNFIKSLQTQTVSSIESTLLQDGLTAQIKTPFSDILNRNVTSG